MNNTQFIKRTLLSFLCLIGFIFTQAQERPFQKDIDSFKKQDLLNTPVKDPILFIGSSSFTNWKDVQDYFPEYPIINRGFGGSTLLNVIDYFDDIVTPYHPKQIVIYCGENDLAASDTIQPATVLSRFKTLHQLIRTQLGNVNIVYISIKPSLSRQRLMPKFKEGNRLIHNFLKQDENATFLNIYDAMLEEDGSPKSDIFLADLLHMNEKGYRIWQKIMKPHIGIKEEPKIEKD